MRAAALLAIGFALLLLALARPAPLWWETAILHGEGDGGLLALAADPLRDPWRIDQGTLARSRTWFFGYPAAWLLGWTGPANAVLVLRLVAGLAAVWLAAVVLWERGWLALAALLACPPFWYYGALGYAVAGTLFAVACATILVEYALDEPDPVLQVMIGALASWAIVTCFYQYAPARLYAVGLVIVLGAGALRRAAFPLLAMVCGLLWVLSALPGIEGAFHARGEQVFAMVEDRDLSGLLGGPTITRTGDAALDLAAVTVLTVRKTSGEVGRVLRGGDGDWLASDPPWNVPLAPWWLLVAAGAAMVGDRRARRLLVPVAAVVGGVLLSSRADLHRLAVLVVPVALAVGWGGQDVQVGVRRVCAWAAVRLRARRLGGDGAHASGDAAVG